MSVSAAHEKIFNLGEGPFWEENTEQLLFVDLFEGNFCRLDPVTQDIDVIHATGTASLIIPYLSNDRQCLGTLGRKIVNLNWDSRKIEIMKEVEEDDKLTRFNDGKCDSYGRLWAGSMYSEHLPDSEREGRGSLYSFDHAFKLKSHLKDLGISNGLAWSSDNRLMFFIDSLSKRVYVFDYDLQNGEISNQRVLVDYNINPEYSEYGFPDGMTIDERGKLWIACFNGGRVLRVDPETAQILQAVILPAKNITSCCFGGKNYDTLYITTAWKGLSEEERKLQPEAGKLFKVTGLDTKGLPPNKFCA